MLTVCNDFSDKYDINFNPHKSKMLIFNDIANNIPPLKLNEQNIPTSRSEKHLGVSLGENASDTRIEQAVKDLNCNTNMLLSEFNSTDINIKYKLFKSFGMNVYGSPLLDYEGKSIELFYTAWRKAIRKLLNISRRTHSNMLHSLVLDLPVDTQLHRRFLKFVYTCSQENSLCKAALKLALTGSNSTMCKNINFICQMYNICKYRLTDGVLSIVSQHSQVDPSIYRIRDFILFRDSFNSCVNYDHINCIVNFLCEN